MFLTPINSDHRGSIATLTGGLQCEEVCILRTKAGYARGGCIHNLSKEHLIVIEGIIEYHYKKVEYEREQIIILHPGQSITIEPKTSHYFISETDSLVMEWGPDVSEKGCRDTEMRRLVEEHNKTI